MNLKYLLIALGCIGSLTAEEQQPAKSALATLQEAMAKKERPALRTAIAEFEKAVKAADLSPNESLPREARAIRSVAGALVSEIMTGKYPKDSPEVVAVAAAFRTTLDLLDAGIEEDYQFQIGTANIGPPPGTRNAAAGMDPAAIDDPVARQQYLDAIAAERVKNLKNIQQSFLRSARGGVFTSIQAMGGWMHDENIKPEEMLERFTNSGKSRELLRKELGLAQPK